MRNAILRLLFVVTLAVVGNLASSPTLHARSGDDICTCDYEAAYLFGIDPTYGPWQFIDQFNPTPFGFYIPEHIQNAGYVCAVSCADDAMNVAEDICTTYGFANHHFQTYVQYTFEDDGEDDGGSYWDIYSFGGSSVAMCDTYF